jgi:hypothetical protein
LSALCRIEDIRRRLGRRSAIEWRLRIVLRKQLDAFGKRCLAGKRNGLQGAVDAGSHAGSGDAVPVHDHSRIHRYRIDKFKQFV